METNQQPGGIVRRNLKDAEMKTALIVGSVSGAVAGTYLIDVNVYWSGLLYLGAAALWFALDAMPPEED